MRRARIGDDAHGYRLKRRYILTEECSAVPVKNLVCFWPTDIEENLFAREIYSIFLPSIYTERRSAQIKVHFCRLRSRNAGAWSDRAGAIKTKRKKRKGRGKLNGLELKRQIYFVEIGRRVLIDWLRGAFRSSKTGPPVARGSGIKRRGGTRTRTSDSRTFSDEKNCSFGEGERGGGDRTKRED